MDFEAHRPTGCVLCSVEGGTILLVLRDAIVLFRGNHARAILQAEDLPAIVSTWGSDLVRRALRARPKAGSTAAKQIVIPRRAYVELAQFTKRALEVQPQGAKPSGWSTLTTGIGLHKTLVTQYLE